MPEVISEETAALGRCSGIGGAIQNFELQKTGSETPQLYRSQTYLRQIIGLGGDRVVKDSQPQQLGTVVDSRRLVLTAGNFTILDMFDKNNVSWDPRQTFLNMAFMTHAAWDFPSDARGYSWGGVAEVYWDDWALRYGRITPPQLPESRWPSTSDLWRVLRRPARAPMHDASAPSRGMAGAVAPSSATETGSTLGSFADAIAAFEANPRENAAAVLPATATSTSTARRTLQRARSLLGAKDPT